MSRGPLCFLNHDGGGAKSSAPLREANRMPGLERGRRRYSEDGGGLLKMAGSVRRAVAVQRERRRLSKDSCDARRMTEA